MTRDWRVNYLIKLWILLGIAKLHKYGVIQLFMTNKINSTEKLIKS